MNIKRNVICFLLFLPVQNYAATAVYYSYRDTSAFQKQSFWSYFKKAPIDVSLIPESLRPYLKDKSLRSGGYFLIKPRFENEIMIFSNGPYYATAWRSGTAMRNEVIVLDSLFKNTFFKKKFDTLEYQFYRLPIYTPINTPGGATSFYGYQMPGIRIQVSNNECLNLLRIVKQTGYTGDAFSCTAGWFNYIPVYSYTDVKHTGVEIKTQQ